MAVCGIKLQDHICLEKPVVHFSPYIFLVALSRSSGEMLSPQQLNYMIEVPVQALVHSIILLIQSILKV